MERGTTMKGLKKRLIALSVLGIVLIGSTVPASAKQMSAFPQQSTAAYSTSYARAIQVMLVNYKSLTRAYIMNSGGVEYSAVAEPPNLLE